MPFAPCRPAFRANDRESQDALTDRKPVALALASFYAPHAAVLSAEEHAAFVGNAIALSSDTVWMSGHADQALQAHNRQRLREAGFAVRAVPLGAIEAGGGSLRCCIGEIY